MKMTTQNTTYRILIADDDRDELTTLADIFTRAAGFDTMLAKDGKEAEHLLYTQDWDFVILDHEMPFRQGREILNDAQRRGLKTPIMILTGKTKYTFAEKDNFKDGADDFVWKPYNHDGLLERVKTQIKKYRETQEAVIAFKGYTFDALRRTVHGEGFESFKLAPQPALVFAAILNSRCQLVTDDIITEKAWDMGEHPTHDTIYGNVKRINRAFTQRGLPEVINIIKETGYELIRN